MAGAPIDRGGSLGRHNVAGAIVSRHQIRFGVGLSLRTGGLDASRHACEQAMESLSLAKGASVKPDLVMMFFTTPHIAHAPQLANVMQRALSPRHCLAVSAESVCAGGLEAERVPAVSVVAMSLPGVELTPFASDTLLQVREDAAGATTSPVDESEALADALGLNTGARLMITLMDPFSVSVSSTLAKLNRAAGVRSRRDASDSVPIVGGLASGSKSAGGNRLLLNDRMLNTGLVGMTLGGSLRVDTVLSQGCRPFGPTMVITAAKNNMILGLAGRPAWDALRELIEQLPDEERPLLERGLFVGRVVNEYKDRFGRDDYLIRAVVGVNEESRGIAVGDLVRVGQTIRFHLRDARTASDDLSMLMDAQRMQEPPAGVLMFTCNGRGTRLFDQPNHDSAMVARSLDPGQADEPGPVAAKSGDPYEPSKPLFPLAGFFSAGEIGPLTGSRGPEAVSHLHGHAASMAVFRQPLVPASQIPAGLETQSPIVVTLKATRKSESKGSGG